MSSRACFIDTVIVNASLSTSIIPPEFKQAIVTPLLKKPGLDTNDMKHFRYVSNLPLISKFLEKVVLIQLEKKKICLATIFVKSFNPPTSKTIAQRLPY